MAAGALLGWAYPAIWLRDRIAVRRRELLRMLPFFLDIITLCVEAGLNMQGAMTQAVAKGPRDWCATNSSACCAIYAPARRVPKHCAAWPSA